MKIAQGTVPVNTEPGITDTSNPSVGTILKSGHTEPPCVTHVLQPGLGAPVGVEAAARGHS